MISAANAGDAVAYGDDSWTGRATRELREAFGARGEIYFVYTGTGANILGLSLLLRPYEGVICAESAHLHTDECGAVERVLGNKLLTVRAPDGKLTPELIASRLAGRADQHRVQPAVVAIAQVSELGTCYTLPELRALREFCREHGLLIYVDGARLANAAAHLGCSLAEIAASADVLSFGGTKNGALGAEAVIVMTEGPGAPGPYLRKQQMQLASKMRYLAAQFTALLEDDLWLRSARHANAMARRLADGISQVPGVTLAQPVQSNAVFAALSPAWVAELQRNWYFHVWDEAQSVVRWMTAFDTTEEDVDLFVRSIQAVAEAGEPVM
jgi:threonine aldolase